MFNSNLMFSSATDLWSTPQSFFDALNAEFNFTLDVCASAENAKCSLYYTLEDDGLKQEWCGICWCNPPYGRGIGDWIKKAFETARGGLLSFVFYLRGPIPHGGTITACAGKSVLYEED